MQHTLPIGYLLDKRYKIEKVLSQGGFGITYKAVDNRIDTTVCIKELFVSGISTRNTNLSLLSQQTGESCFADFIERFINEAKQIAKFRHPNIVSVTDMFQANNTAYMVMEYVESNTMQSIIKKNGPLIFDKALPMMNQLLNAVEEVHNKGMLHRDIKPDNILITKTGQLVLIDFGSAREFVEGKTLSQTAILTPGYAPLEQYSHRKPRGRYTDIYAIGATFYNLLTGIKPLPATDRIDEDLNDPHLLNINISTQVSSAIMLAMQRKPEDRFQSVGEFRSALLQLESYSEKSETKQVESLQIEKKSKKEIIAERQFLLFIVSLIAIILLSLVAVTIVR